ncbi:uncharacterized protein LOC123313905 [Coccinella septempunctata]|uniref:uncharacterized protein LOC123313905 n=1 Tax=Coccinella septempunctata TaxID=41139 RepID=UPI001D093F9B|nr:uncharacterized protein LOC123313905 [Coccinella septempunctata]
MMRVIQISFCVVVFAVFAFGDKTTNCDKGDIHFEKVLGYKPSDENKPLLLHRNDSHPVTVDCIQKCQSNQDCRSFILDYKTSTCYWYRHSVDENGIVPDNNIAWFVKICLRGNPCPEKLWKFERIPGAILIGNDTKTLPEKVTRNECEQNCLSSKSFECRSTKFRVKNANYNENFSAMGTCTLSDSDRRLSPSGFRVGRDVEEYFENQCSSDYNGSKNTFCAYEEYGDVLLQHVDLIYEKKSKSECEEICDKLTIFHCRGFSLKPAQTGFTCLIHSEDSKINGPRLLEESRKGFYYEKAKCLNVTVTCTEDSITIDYRPETNFSGRIYMQGYSDHPECFTKGKGFKTLSLRLPLPTSQCGITEAATPDNRRLLSGSLIIQYNSFVQMQGDRLIKVGCIFANDSKLVVGTGVTVAPIHSDNGSSLINSTNSPSDGGTPSGPSVQMKLVDHYSKQEVSDIQIGQDVDLIIEASTKGNFDIWVSHLVAMTENGGESIMLLDDSGCPVDNNVFPPMVKSRMNNVTTLTGTFQAFKFSSSPAVRFSVIVQFCPEKCPEVDCRNHSRHKRGQYKTLNGTIQSINRTEFELINSQFYKRPLEIMVVVRNNNLSPDRLAFGSNKVLVAGYNYETNEVCVDYSLLLGLVISWVLIQIIFAIACIIMVRKYKKYYQEEYLRQAYDEYNKNFDIGDSNLDSRRVRWADSGDEVQ